MGEQTFEANLADEIEGTITKLEILMGRAAEYLSEAHNGDAELSALELQADLSTDERCFEVVEALRAIPLAA